MTAKRFLRTWSVLMAAAAAFGVAGCGSGGYPSSWVAADGYAVDWIMWSQHGSSLQGSGLDAPSTTHGGGNYDTPMPFTMTGTIRGDKVTMTITGLYGGPVTRQGTISQTALRYDGVDGAFHPGWRPDFYRDLTGVPAPQKDTGLPAPALPTSTARPATTPQATTTRPTTSPASAAGGTSSGAAFNDLLGTWAAVPDPAETFQFLELPGHPGEITTADLGGVGIVGATETDILGLAAGSGELKVTYNFTVSSDTITVNDGSSQYQSHPHLTRPDAGRSAAVSPRRG